jgi:YfiH family protein
LRPVKKRGVSYYQFEAFEKFPDIIHGVFTRGAGYSRGPFQGLNISYGLGDDDRNVLKNRDMIARCLGDQKLVFVDQVHGNHVVVLGDNCFADPAKESGPQLFGDALVTDLRRRLLVIQAADCQAVMMHDPVRAAVANVHAGWRGSVNAIIERTVEVMINHYGSQPRDIVAGIGPSLGPCCAEFVNFRREIPEQYWSYKDDAHHFDFWAISRDQLCNAGLLPDNISIGGICTRCNPERFFSYRGEGTTGRFAAVIGLR